LRLVLPQKPDNFTTLPITITEGKLDKGALTSFKFISNDWYPPGAPLGTVIINKGLSGDIDIKTGKGSFTAKYQNPNNGVISIFEVTGTK